MMTNVTRKPLGEMVDKNSNMDVTIEQEMTVEEYLTRKCQEIIKDLYAHSDSLISKLSEEYREGAASIRGLMQITTTTTPLCVTLKCIAGSHMGQRFRLEPGSGLGEDVFKIGRSTGKVFKERGVSLYKDKEISTTHAKIEVRNGQAFLVDVRSTNGTLLNGETVEPQVPMRLRENDVITMGTTDLQVHISGLDPDDISGGAIAPAAVSSSDGIANQENVRS